MTGSELSTYRWSRAYGLRVFGAVVIALAAWWVVTALLDFPMWALVALGFIAGVAAVVLLRLVVVPLRLLDVSADGYRLRSTRSGGVTSADWSSVDSIASEDTASGTVMVVRLHDGRTTVVPLKVLGAAAPAAERDVHERLNAAFGYRRLDDAQP